MVKVGVTCVDITLPVGTSMDGFAAREPSSIGVHDGYEVDRACRVGPEAADLIIQKCLELLEELHDKNQAA